ncbi:uncharacterized protein CC84DRAFT_1256831 [Paraphaeosphaeria sporulosa]|uniref:Uncharacterized protein n=1 Tax=Paraphaeosphaeria sporulosa TaxID=1460663 RepID=A0A177CK11_9PLEO|nr:uncharacterized protein CC84DRAFT_1256831 [Paraphaeosphaeria sporulosa]OAG07864.1 hypothetical protein CC84DRAFT_1256831 [Paraphaeosphaeria sporulosa]
MSLISTPATTPPVPASKPGLAVQAAALMQQILSSKPEGWKPSPEWVSSSEIAVHLSLWTVTCDEWISAWQNVLKTKQRDKVRMAYGSENPYAWSGLETQGAMKTDEQQGAVARGKLPGPVPSRQVDEGSGASAGAPSERVPVKAILHARPETLVRVYGASSPSPSLGAPGTHAYVPADPAAEQLFVPYADSPTLPQVLAVGREVRRRRGKAASVHATSSPAPLTSDPAVVTALNAQAGTVAPLPDAQKYTSAVATGPEIPAPSEDGGFVLRNFRYRSLAELEQAVAYSAHPRNERASMWGRIVRRMRG